MLHETKEQISCILPQIWRSYELILSLVILYMISSPSFIGPVSISPHCALNHSQPTPSTVLSTQGRLLLPQNCCPSINSPPNPNLCCNLVGGAAPAGIYRVIVFSDGLCPFVEIVVFKKKGYSFRVVTGGES